MAYLWHTDGRTLWPVNTLQLQFLISILAGWVRIERKSAARLVSSIKER